MRLVCLGARREDPEKRKECLEDVGIEPTAFRMQSGRSTTELNSQVQCNGNRRIELGLICLRQASSAP